MRKEQKKKTKKKESCTCMMDLIVIFARIKALYLRVKKWK
jgi:hypothetical protein